MEDEGMKRSPILSVVIVLALGVLSLGFTGCEDKEAQAEVARLEDELAAMRQEITRERTRAEAANEQMQEVRKELNALKIERRTVDNRLRIAERAVEQYKKREESAKTAKEREPSRKEKLDAGKEAAGGNLGALVEIKGDVNAGKGFVVEADEKTWIYFSPTILVGNSKLEVTRGEGGKLEKFGAFELAKDAGLARLEVQDEVATKMSVGDASTLGSGAAVFGITEDGSLSEGRFYGAEGTTFKADSRLAQNPLGTPVFHGETGALIGVLLESGTVERELWPQQWRVSTVGSQEVCRLDRTIAWETSSIGGFLDESKAIEEADRLTRLVTAFATVRPSEGGLSFDGAVGGGVLTAREVLADFKDQSAVRSLMDLDVWLKEKGPRASEKDREKKIQRVYEDMVRISKGNTATLEAKKFSAYFAASAAKSLEWRKAAEEKLAAIVKGLEE